ncbi:MAG TPA: cbb3-type cytochrome c oxidase subunit I [Gemmatimonadaceae bacterium]|nr:cbb3-type cytochrome c oxidase subunit I [Gemmatimonadaceae bacterium]
MHSLVRRYIKTAILFLGVGLALGGWMMVRREMSSVAPSSYIVSAHTHAIFVGFVMMMILGVALWMFPRPEKGDTRYSPRVAEGAYWLVTLGTAGRIAGEIARPVIDSPALRWAILLCGAAQIGGIAIFFVNMWPRIRPLGSRAREARGEKF